MESQCAEKARKNGGFRCRCWQISGLILRPFSRSRKKAAGRDMHCFWGLPGTGSPFFDVGDLITETRAADGYTDITANRKPGQGARALPSRADHPDRRRTGNMKEFWKKWRRAILFTAGGAGWGLFITRWQAAPPGPAPSPPTPGTPWSIRGLSGCFFPAAWAAAAAEAAAAANRPNDRNRSGTPPVCRSGNRGDLNGISL